MAIVPDTKNWTWVLDERCPECGFEASEINLAAMGELVRTNVGAWPSLLAADNARIRPRPDRWSALEYGCHVRDVFVLFDERLRLMLETDAPQFANWDQDVTAAEQRYDLQDPVTVCIELVAAGRALAERWDGVRSDQWQRTGDRSDGSSFTVESFARYFLHDPVHHVRDVVVGNELLGRRSPADSGEA